MVSESSGTQLVLKPSEREEDQCWVLVKLLSKAGILNPFCAMNVLGFLVKLTDLLGKKKLFLNAQIKEWDRKGYQLDQNCYQDSYHIYMYHKFVLLISAS